MINDQQLEAFISPPENESFSEQLARFASDPDQQYMIIRGLLKNAADGDTSALKEITKALNESKFKDEDNLPINDSRIKEIFLLAADAIRAGEV